MITSGYHSKNVLGFLLYLKSSVRSKFLSPRVDNLAVSYSMISRCPLTHFFSQEGFVPCISVTIPANWPEDRRQEVFTWLLNSVPAAAAGIEKLGLDQTGFDVY